MVAGSTGVTAYQLRDLRRVTSPSFKFLRCEMKILAVPVLGIVARSKCINGCTPFVRFLHRQRLNFNSLSRCYSHAGKIDIDT